MTVLTLFTAYSCYRYNPVSAQTVPPVTYYVAANGSDSNSGTSPDSPWQTLTKVNATTLNPGDSVLFNRGDTFYGSLIVSDSGTAGNPITFGSYGSGNNDPVISGFTTLSGWKNISPNIYEADCSQQCGSTVSMVTLNGQEQAMGRYPNADAANGGYLTFESHAGTTSITDPTLSSSPDWTGADLVMRTNHWIIDVNPITSDSNGTLSYTLGPSSSGYAPDNGFGYFIENSLATLDENGEWYYNPATKVLDMYLNTDPSEDTIQVATVGTLVAISNKDNVTFQGLSFQGSNASMFNLVQAQNITIQNDNISFAGVNGINIYGSDNDGLTIEGNTIEGTLSDSIVCLSSCSNTLINNNTITNTAMLAGMGKSGNETYNAVEIFGDNNTISDNTITNTGFIPINFEGSSVSVQNNIINGYTLIKDDGGGIYTYNGINAADTNRVVSNNYISNGIGASAGSITEYGPFSHGIYMDNNSSDVEIDNNTVTSSGNGIFLHDSQDIGIKNNILYNNGIQFMMVHDTGDTINNITVSNNTFAETNATQTFLSAQTSDNAYSSFGTFSYNAYVHPTSVTSNFDVAGNPTDLSSWQSQYSYDTNSDNILSDNFEFEPNATPSPSTITLDGIYVDTSGNTYNGSATIPAYGSLILLPSTALPATPTISLNGSSTMTFNVGDTFTDPGATASDTVDGDISSKITTSGSVDTNTAGTYTLTYRVTDSAGNTVSVTRTVLVVAVEGQSSGGGGTDAPLAIATPPASNITETVSQPITAPVSNTISFSAAAAPTPAVPATTPPVPVSAPTKPAVAIAPVVATTAIVSGTTAITPPAPDPYANDPAVEALRERLIALAPSTTVVSIDYSLDGTLMHTSTTLPDTWNFDTTTVSNGVHNLTIVYHYKDGSTQSSITVFTVHNDSTVVDSITTILGDIWKQLKEDVGRV